ncbi:3'-5'-exoribonuclease [Polyrhizophydium stewartii]|uniref:3'-5'-exoribonuclease n=1 Tax=Polyrhizophydium stewartii TaxID=2732419 RepID=A0ABR4NAW4_9FUNG|nr:hypothetical protein HK105_008288 [Polyrhizophydium stewartii]
MDRKRIAGPEKSVVPLPAPAPPVNPQTARPDKRRRDQIRSLYTKTGSVTQANGSAYVEAGNIKVLCAVYGPRQSSSKNSSSNTGTLQCDFKYAPFSGGKRRGYAKDDQEKEFSLVLEQALTPAVRLEQYPKSTIQAFVLVLENDGSLASLAAAISCAALALANAGIEMNDLVTACAAGYFGSAVCLDPTLDEEAVQSGAVLLSYMPVLNEVTHLIQTGEIAPAQCVQAVELCIGACSQIHTVTQEALLAE